MMARIVKVNGVALIIWCRAANIIQIFDLLWASFDD